MPAPLINPYTGLVVASRGSNLQVQQAIQEFQRKQKDEQRRTQFLLSQQYPKPTKMGGQSQLRQGSIFHMKKRGSKKHNLRRGGGTYIQMSIKGGEAFNRLKHCRICFIRNENEKRKRYNLQHSSRKKRQQLLTLPKRAHHDMCPKRKSKNKTIDFEKEMAKYKKINNTPIATNIGTSATAPEQYAQLFPYDHEAIQLNIVGTDETRKKSAAAREEAANAKQSNVSNITCNTPTDKSNVKSNVVIASNDHSVAEELQDAINTAIQNGDFDGYGQSKSCRAPANVEFFIKYIRKQFHHRKTPGNPNLPISADFLESMQQYHRFFNDHGDITFTFPKHRKDDKPNPLYHCLEGREIFNIDWQISHPKEWTAGITCPACKQSHTLIHTGTNISNGTLFPVIRKGGLVMWGSVMNYKCKSCNKEFKGNDGSLLASLPAHMRQSYPVDPRYAANNQFHLAAEITDNIDSGMRTYCNGDYYSRQLHELQAKEYTRYLENYYSLGGKLDYPYFSKWIGIYPPSGQTIRDLYNNAERSINTPTGVSNYDRYRREIQSVQDAIAVAIDWTFQVLKNYALPGAKACFTMMTSTRQVANIALVASEAVHHISHLIEQMMRRRKNFRPKVVYTDIWPKQKVFWEKLLKAEGRLGLFHCLQRITDTLNHRCTLYGEALFELRMCFYEYRDEDLKALLQSLGEGTFDGEKRSQEDIQKMQHSKQWKAKCESCLRKDIRGKECIILKLNKWLEDWATKRDRDGTALCPPDPPQIPREAGSNPLGRSTTAAIKLQERNVQYLQEPPEFDPYQRIKPRPNSTRQIPTYKSDRPEPHAENAHKYMQHFGNGNMRPELADVLTIGGVAERNCDVRHDQLRAAGKFVTTYLKPPPLHFDEHAVFKDHLYLKHINLMAEKNGAALPFFNLFDIKEDNGEEFGSVHYKEWKKREEQADKDGRLSVGESGRRAGRCTCNECFGNPEPYMTDNSTSPNCDNLSESTAPQINEITVASTETTPTATAMVTNTTEPVQAPAPARQPTPAQAPTLARQLPVPQLVFQPALQTLAPTPSIQQMQPHVQLQPQMYNPYCYPAFQNTFNPPICTCTKVHEYQNYFLLNGKRRKGPRPKHSNNCPTISFR